MRGVRSAQVRDFIWRDHHGVGVGYYTGENFVHIDELDVRRLETRLRYGINGAAAPPANGRVNGNGGAPWQSH